MICLPRAYPVDRLAGFFGFLQIPRKITGKAAYVLLEALMRSVWRLRRCDGQKPVKLGIGALALFTGVGAARGDVLEFFDKVPWIAAIW